MAGGIQLAPLLTQMKVDIKTFKSDMDKVKTEAVGKAKEVSKEMSNTAKMGESLSSIGGKMTKAITLPVIAAGTAAAKFNFDYADSLAKVSTIADTTKVPIGKLSNGIMNLSNKTGVAAKDLNEALYQSISASVDTADAVGFVEVATKAAKGGFTDATTAVDGLSTVLNTYGLKATEVDKIANQMLITQNKGKTSFGDLASSMGQVAPAASLLGLKTEELFSSLASTTAQGLSTSEATTGLSAAFSNIVKPSEDAKKAAESLGISFNVSTLQTKGWMPFLEDLKGKLKEASPAYAELSDRNDELGRKMNQLKFSGKENSKEFKDLNKQHKAMGKEMEVLAQAADSPIGAFATMFGSVRGLNSMLMLTSDNGMKTYNDTMKEMETNTTALDDAFNKMDSTPGEEMKKAMNDIRNLGIEMGDILVPVIRDVVSGVRDVTSKFRDLSPATKENIVRLGIMAATMGPLLKVTGGTIGMFAKLKPVVTGVNSVFKLGAPVLGKFLGKMGLMKAVGATASTAIGGVSASAGAAAGATGIGALSVSLGTVALAAGTFAIGAGAIVGAGYAIHKGLSKDVVPTVDLFADKTIAAVDKVNGGVRNFTTTISEGTKEAVGSYMEMDRDVGESLFNMKNKHLIVTGEMATELTGKLDAMGQMIISKSNEKYEAMLTDTKTFFAENNSLTDEEKAEVLAKMDTNQRLEQGKIKSNQDEITRILNLARDENRSNTETEVKQMEMLQMNMKNDAVRVLSETEQESNIIRERLKEHQGRVNAEMASELLTKAYETRDKSIESAKAQYEGVVKNANTLLQAGTINQQQYDKMIKDGQEARDKNIKSAEQMAEGVRDEIVAGTPGIEKDINTQTGKIMTSYDKVKSGLKGVFDWIFKNNSKAASEASNISYGGGGNNKARVSENWTGTNHFKGGLTTLHERGEEIYDLPQGTRIYNAERSEQMVIETARHVAEQMMQGMGDRGNSTINFNGNYGFNDKSDIDYFMNQAALKLKGVR